jgi:Superinfection immunity protein
MIITFLLFFVPILYMLPTAIALLNRHKHAVSIGVLNLCGGWTGIGWLAALVWSFTK